MKAAQKQSCGLSFFDGYTERDRSDVSPFFLVAEFERNLCKYHQKHKITSS